ncbi:MAG: hypothetical protein R3D63_17070 [Paracoccaceae bacterium]
MALAWQAVTAGLDHGGYAAWEAAVEQAAGGPPRLVPILARLVAPPGSPMDLAGAIAATLALPGIDLSRHERDLLLTEQAHAGPGWPHEVRLVAYAPRSLLAAPPAFWQVLGVGPGLSPAETAPPPLPAQDLTALPGPLAPDVPVMAIIDEGIAHLNARFRAGPRQTRFLSLWLQADERRAQGPVGPWGDIRLGRVLTRAEIDAQLASGLTEAETYAQINRALYPVPTRAATGQRLGHGTHVLDLACGAGFAEPMAASPILAVQLPPASIRDTAGRRMESHLIQGLRWILAEVLRHSNGTRVPPLVLNLSLGALAGPGDASEFLADWLDYELTRHARMAPGAQVRIAGAFGNARLSRLAARAEARLQRPVTLDWRVLPDDRTASFLELRVDRALSDGLSLTLTPPPGSGLPPLHLDWPQRLAGSRLEQSGPESGPIAAVTFMPEPGGQALCHIALAPSRPAPGAARAAPGLWRLVLGTSVNEPVRLVARVQRDDTPMGHASYGRQSWLDHPEGWTWDSELRDFTRPRPAQGGTPPCPVTREGTAVSYAGTARDDIYLVGATRPGPLSAPASPADWRPSLFSSEGADHMARPGETAGPALAAPGEAGPMLGGLRAAGILSGSSERLAGTSMAAPAVARRLLDYFRATPPADRNLTAEHAALTRPGPWNATRDRRLGHGILIPAPA